VKTLPNIITIFRVIAALGLFFFGVENPIFWVLYLACGISDMLDGYLARKLHCESKTGAQLDSMADIVFVACCCIKLIPVLALPNWLWIWALVIALIKVINQISALVIYKKCVFPHTIANKVTGFLLFVGIPVTFFVESLIPIIIVAIFATFAAIQEGHFIRTKKISF
jgi:CDP-diacylglycerol--glycerol-3-phosphate 3-phosphatidyltransferase